MFHLGNAGYYNFVRIHTTLQTTPAVQLFVHPRYLIYLYLRLAVLQPSDGVVGIIDGLLHRWQPTDIHANLIDLELLQTTLQP